MGQIGTFLLGIQVQLLALYTDPVSHNVQRYRQTDIRTDGQTDDRTMPIADHIVQQYDRLKCSVLHLFLNES